MSSRDIVFGFISSTLIATSAHAALAGDGGSAFVGGLLGSAIGTAITGSIQQRNQTQYVRRTYVTPRAPGVSSYQRETNRQVQTALNYFGFPAGVPDGVIGANSRAAIGLYQAFMGYPPSGFLSDYERGFLTTSYERAVVGGAATAQAIASAGQGTRGLLLVYRQEQTGGPVAVPVVAPPALVPPVAAPPAAAPPEVAAAPVVTEAAAPPPAAAAPPTGGLPNFIGGAAEPSMSAICNRTSIATSRNGGPIVFQAGQTLDAEQTLDEQFCLARTYAIDEGDTLGASATDFTPDEIETQCAAFAPSMREYVAHLTTETPAEATAALRSFVDATGISAAQLSANMRICLGTGYRTDDPDVALASALVLVGLGETTYAELVGYHLLGGFGTPARGEVGIAWFGTAVDALANGAPPIVNAKADERLDLLQATRALLLTGENQAPTPMEASGGATLAPSDGTPRQAAAPAPMALPVPKTVSN